MKFSVSECLPLNVTGFSYLILVGCNYVPYGYYYVCDYGIFYYYYTPLIPASATGY